MHSLVEERRRYSQELHDNLGQHLVAATSPWKCCVPTLPGSAIDRKSTRLNSSHMSESRMPSSA